MSPGIVIMLTIVGAVILWAFVILGAILVWIIAPGGPFIILMLGSFIAIGCWAKLTMPKDPK